MSDKKILELKKKLEKRIRDCWHGKETSCGCDRIKCSEPNCKAWPWLHTITSHFYKSHPDLTPNFRLQSGFAPFDFACSNCQKSYEAGEDKGPYHFYWNSGRLEPHETFCETCATKFKELRGLHQTSTTKKLEKIMTKKAIKPKKSSIKESSAQKSANKEIKKNSSLSKPTTKLLTPRSVRSKENTLAYYNCLIDQVASPLNQRVKITAMCHQCKHNKGKVQVAKEAEKQQLVKEVAQNYLAFGKSLSNLLHADITCCEK